MYEYIRGKISDLKPANIVVEAGQVGYFINISLNTYSQLSGKAEATIYLHQVIREDAHVLYGFSQQSERELFRLLISVNGVGSNTAIMMLSSMSPEEIKVAIATENVNALKSIKGIGIKTAQRIIIDLKDKIEKAPVSEQILFAADNTIRDEALSALVMLGFNRKAVEKELDKLIAAEPGCKVETLIKKALKNL
jgi:Holliday junction DNA helicase RuvA